jgi:hypothetical protein
VAEHYPTLWRLVQLAKLQSIAKWLIQHNVFVDLPGIVRHISLCTRSSESIEKVWVLQRDKKKYACGGVDLSVRKSSGGGTSEDNDTLERMILESPRCTYPIPFLAKKLCHVCSDPIPFSTLFRNQFDGKSYCDEHHPDACFGCALPLQIDPFSKEPVPTYTFVSVHKQNSNDSVLYHPECFECATCEMPIIGPYKMDNHLEMCCFHPDCVHPLDHCKQNFPSVFGNFFCFFFIFLTVSIASYRTNPQEDKDDPVLTVHPNSKTEAEFENSANSKLPRDADFIKQLTDIGVSDEALLANILHQSAVVCQLTCTLTQQNLSDTLF